MTLSNNIAFNAAILETQAGCRGEIAAVLYHLDWKAVDRDARFDITWDAKPDVVRAHLETAAYRKVAELTTDDLDKVYQDTNHIHGQWQRNRSVYFACEQARSTSVGDVIQTRDGLFVVSNVGFQRLQAELSDLTDEQLGALSEAGRDETFTDSLGNELGFDPSIE